MGLALVFWGRKLKMSKANRNFVQADEAVSPVIGVILMVAITVVLAAVVFVLVSNLSKTSGKGEEAAISAKSPQPGILEIVMVTGGTHGPYTNSDMTDVNDYTVSLNGVPCDLDGTPDTGIVAPDPWGPGGVLRLSSSGATPAGCAEEVTAGATISVSVSVAGSLVYSSTVQIHV